LRFFVTGCAGFIGSALTDRLLAEGHVIVGYDNLSTGFERFLFGARVSRNFRLVRADLLDTDALDNAIRGAEVVFHLAANADVRFGADHPRKDLEQNTIATHNLLEAARKHGVAKFLFASTGSVYGEPKQFPTPEDAAFPIQTSLYGASKLACEGLIAAYCEAFGFQAHIFRFVSILGERYSHGHVFDFYKQLRSGANRLSVLGDGTQRKSYLYVQDCIDAMLIALDKANARVNIFNLGCDGYCAVNDSIRWICETLGVRPALEYSGGPRGWIGDNPFVFLDTSAIRRLGWHPKLSIQQSVVRTVDYLRENTWLLDARP
jgi:UDP-glucose 4-epimerase